MKSFDYKSPQAERIIKFLDKLEKDEKQEAKVNQEEYSHEYYPANGLFPGFNDNFVVGFDIDQAGSIKRKGYDPEIRIFNSPDLIKIFDEYGKDRTLEILNNLTFIFLQRKIKTIEKEGFTGSNSLWHKGINNFLKSGFKPITKSKRSKKNVSDSTRMIYIEVYSHYRRIKSKGGRKNSEIYEELEAFMYKHKATKKFFGKSYKKGHIKNIIEHKLYLAT